MVKKMMQNILNFDQTNEKMIFLTHNGVMTENIDENNFMNSLNKDMFTAN